MDSWKKISKKQIDPVYLVYGTETFLINETKQLLIEHVLDEDEKDFNLAVYDLEETPVEAAIEDAETFPFMGEKRLVFLQNPSFLTSEKAKGKVEHNLAKLEEYLAQPAPYSVVVFSAPYEKLDERKKITKELKRKAAVIEAKKLTEQELKVWIRERAAAGRITIEEDAIQLLMSLSGTNLFMLTSEIDKLALYAGESRLINKEMVDKLTARSLEQNIFSLVDNAVHRNVEAALRIYYDLLKQNEEPIKILSVISGQFRLIYQVKELTRRGYSQQQIAGSLKIHPFRIKLAAAQAGTFADQDLTRIIKLLADADYQMKTGGMRKEMLIEMILFQINGRK